MPIIVGGNGQKVTWRLAARYAGELDLDGPGIDNIAAWIPVVYQRCEEIGRDPSTLRVSALYVRGEVTGQERVEGLSRMAEISMTRIQSPLPDDHIHPDWLRAYAADCRAAGIALRA